MTRHTTWVVYYTYGQNKYGQSDIFGATDQSLSFAQRMGSSVLEKITSITGNS